MNNSIIQHILKTIPCRVVQRRILNVGLSDHQAIYYTGKVTRIKRDNINQRKYGFFKSYTVDGSEKALGEALDFPNNENVDNVNYAYSNFI